MSKWIHDSASNLAPAPRLGLLSQTQSFRRRGVVATDGKSMGNPAMMPWCSTWKRGLWIATETVFSTVGERIDSQLGIFASTETLGNSWKSNSLVVDILWLTVAARNSQHMPASQKPRKKRLAFYVFDRATTDTNDCSHARRSGAVPGMTLASQVPAWWGIFFSWGKVCKKCASLDDIVTYTYTHYIHV